MHLSKRFGKRLKELRSLKKLTQAQLAELSGLSVPYLGRVERGQAAPSFTVIEQLCSALETEPANLFLFSDVADEPSTAVVPSDDSEKASLYTEYTNTFVTWTGSWKRNLDSGMDFWSMSLQRLLGYSSFLHTPGEAFFLKHVHKDDAGRVKTWLDKVLHGESISDFEFRLVRKDGPERNVIAHSDCLENAFGRPETILIMIMDITEWRRLQVELLKNREQLENYVAERTENLRETVQHLDDEVRRRAAVEHELHIAHNVAEAAVDGLAFVDADLTCIFANTRMKKALGKARDDIAGKPVAELFDSEFYETTVRPLLEQALSGRRVRYCDWMDATPEGRMFVDVTCTPFMEKGKVAGVVVTAHDATELKQSQMLHRYEAETVRSLLSATHDFVFLLDRNGIVLECNANVSQRFGLSPDEMQGKSIYDVIPAPLQQQRRKHLEAAFTTARVQTLQDEREGTHFNHTFFPIMNKQGEVQRVLIISNDITARVHNKNALQESEKRYRSLVRALPDLIFVYDSQGNFLDYHAPDTSLLYTAPENFLGRNVLEVLPENLGEPTLRDIQALINGEEIPPHQYSLEVLGEERFFERHAVRLDIDKAMYIIRDITDIKLSEKALRESEERYRMLFEHGGVLSSVYDINGTCLMMNRQTAALFGGRPEDYAGKSFYDFHADAAEEYTRRIRKAITTQTTGKYEDTVSFHGSERRLISTVYPLRNTEDEIYAAQIVSMDITERKRAEEALQESELEYRSLFENMQEGFLRADSQGIIFMANKAAADIFGYTDPEQLIGLQMSKLYATPEIRAQFIEQLHHDNSLHNIECTMLRRDGTPLWALCNVTLVKDADGAPLYTEGLLRDISRFKQAQEEANIKQQAIETSISAVALADLQGNLTYVNPAFLAMWGYTSTGEVLGRSALEFWEEPEKAAEVVQTLMKQGSIATEMRGIRADGRSFDTYLSASLVHDSSAKTVNLMASFVDITDIRKAEAMLRDAQRLARIGSWENDLQTGEVMWSDEIFRILGYEPGEVKPAHDITRSHFHPDDLERVVAGIEHSRTIGEAFDREVRIIRKDGETRIIHLQGEIITNEAGRPVRSYGTMHDITERKLAERALRESEARFRALFEQAGWAVFFHDDKGRFLDINAQACRLSGYSKDELLKLTVFDMDPDAEERGDAESFWSSDTDDFIRFQGRHKLKDGVCIPVDITVKRIQYAGRPAFLAMVQDITERLQAEEALLKSEARYRLLADHSADIIWTTDINHRYTYISPSVERLLGYTPDEILQIPLTERVTDESWQVLQEKMRGRQEQWRQGRQDDRTIRMELEQIRKDGSTVWTDVVSSPIFDDKGNPAGIIGITRDISARKSAEDALRESEGRYRLLTDNMRDILWTRDENMRVTYMSPSVKDVLGYTPEEVMAESDVNRFTPKSLAELKRQTERFRRMMSQGLADIAQERLEMEAIHKNGTIVPIEVDVKVVTDDSGHFLYLLGVTRDITERKRDLERILAAKQEAEEATKAKTHFLANMSHDIRTPLNGILGMIQLLFHSELQKQQKEFLTHAQTAARNLLNLINDILDLSKVEAGKMEVIEEPVRLSEFIHAECTIFKTQAQGKGLEFTMDIAPSVPEQFVTDPSRLSRILNNLLSNALKFTESGEIRLSITHISQKSAQQDILLKFTVSDTGPGIPENVRGRLFEPFVQDSSRRKNITGSGLGLSIVNRFTRLLGGDVRVESAPGEGSAFIFTIRAKPCTAEQQTPHSPKPSSTQQQLIARESQTWSPAEAVPSEKATILLAEDDAVNRLTAVMMLEKLGYTVIKANNGKEALDMLRQHSIDLVLMDIQMPVMDGIIAVQTLRSKTFNIPDHNVPVVALSAYVTQGDRRRLLSCGFNDILSKPVDIKTMQQCITDLLASCGKGNS